MISSRSLFLILALSFVCATSGLDAPPSNDGLVTQAVAKPCPTADCPEPALQWAPLPDGTPYPGTALLDSVQNVPLETTPLPAAPSQSPAAAR